MIRLASICLCLLFPLTSAFAQTNGANTPASSLKLAVVPFAALSGDVPQRAGSKAAGMFSTELKNTEGLQLAEVKRTAPPDPHAEGLERARKLVSEAKDLRQKRKFRLADETLQKALGEYRTAAAG